MDASGWTSPGPDFSERYRHEAQQLAHRYAIMEGVVGVVLVGGLTFGEADRYSDIDLIVYLRQQSLRTWYYGEAPLPEGESRYHDLRLDVSYRDYERETERPWTSTEVWGASRAGILYDPEGLVRELLTEKSRGESSTADEALDLAARVRFRLDRNVPAWLYRGEALAVHAVLNDAIDDLVALIHLINDLPAPETGWSIALLDHLERTPTGAESMIQEAMRTGDLSVEDASRRRYAVNRLLQACWEMFAPGETLHDRPDAVRQALMLRHLVHAGSMSLDDYHHRFDRRLLIQSPAFDLVAIDRQHHQTRVTFDYDRLRHLVNHELGRFLDYQQRLLRELADVAATELDS